MYEHRELIGKDVIFSDTLGGITTYWVWKEGQRWELSKSRVIKMKRTGAVVRKLTG